MAETTHDDPLAILLAWIDEAERAGEVLPEAMTLATATRDGAPSARMVLLRGRSEDGGALRFFTNYDSRKGHELTENPRAALVFHWKSLTRQVRVEGEVERLSAEASDAYFASRPRGSQLSAAVSPQSRPIEGLAVLERERLRLAEALGDAPVPRPAHWGGYQVRADVVELWIGGGDRWHERRCYRRVDDGWTVESLAP